MLLLLSLDSQSSLSQRTAQLSQRDKQIELLTKQAALQREQMSITMRVMEPNVMQHVSRRERMSVAQQQRDSDQFTEATSFFQTPAKPRSSSQLMSP